MRNDSSAKEWLLEVGYPLLDSVELYLPTHRAGGPVGKSYAVKKTGDTLPFGEREIADQNFIFILPVGPEEEQTVYLRVETEGSMQIPLTILSYRRYIEKDHNERSASGLYNGIILAMLLYNLFLFFSLRDRNYLYYVIYIAGFGLMMLSLGGQAFEYLWPNLPWWGNRAIPFFISFSIFWLSKFSSSFLLAKVNAPRLDRIFYLLMGLSGVVMIWALVGNYTVATMISGGLTMLFIPVAISVGLISWRKGYRLARYYVIAWSILMVGTAAYIMTSFGILPNNYVTANGMQIGSALQVILLSLALADRINIIREEKEIAQAMAIENLYKADRMKDEFLANTSHELKTPLNGILGIAEAMLDGAAGRITADQQARLAMILSSGNRLLYLVNDILDASRLKHHDISLRSEPVDLRQITDIVILLAKPLLSGKSLELENHIGADLPPALGDENRLQQIMYNLIGNAIKFTESGKISVDAAVAGELLEVTVADTGIGIPEDMTVTIFEPYKQADASISRMYGGTGLGLSITKQLVELHGGSVCVHSEVGRGSQFVFTLPTSRGKTRSAPRTRVAAVRIDAPTMVRTIDFPAQEQKPFKILAVDDDPINLQVVVDFLSLAGYATERASSGQEALRAVQKDHHDLVLLDVMMPGMSGYEVCRKLRETQSGR